MFSHKKIEERLDELENRVAKLETEMGTREPVFSWLIPIPPSLKNRVDAIADFLGIHFKKTPSMPEFWTAEKPKKSNSR